MRFQEVEIHRELVAKYQHGPFQLRTNNPWARGEMGEREKQEIKCST
jgi:hypothetical protein